MKNRNIKVVSTALALTTVLGITAGIAINTNKQMETLGYTPVNAMSMDARNESKDEFATVDNGAYNSVIGGTAINEYATYVEYQNIDGSHEIRAWGYNHDGLLGNGDSNESTKLGWAEATKVDLDMTGKTLKFMESLNDTIFVVLEDNNGGADEVWAWGNNDKGQLFIDGEDFVSTPTRILEDVIPTWGSVVGIDASVGSTVVYFQGTEGQEYDPLNYNDESLWMYGAGDTSKDQDANQSFFETPLRLYSKHYIDSDANSQAYTMIYKDAADEEWQDSRIISWGDNSNGVLGTGDTSQPEDGYFTPVIHDEDDGWMPSAFMLPGETTVLDEVATGEENFIYQAQSTYAYSTSSSDWYTDLNYITGSKEIGGGVGYYEGAALFDAIDDHGIWSSYVNGNSASYGFGQITAGNGFVTYVDLRQNAGVTSAIMTVGDDVDIETIPEYLDKTARWEGIGANPYTPYNTSTEIDSFLDSNNSTTIWTSSTNPDVEGRYEMSAWGSNSNGIFDKYSNSEEPEHKDAFIFGTDLYNYENIGVDVVDGTIHSTTVDFTVDTTNDSGMINPNSYELNIKANGEDWNDNLELVSFEDGIATYRASNLLRDTDYVFEYSFNETDEVYHEAFSFKTTDKVAPDPIIKSVEFVPITELDSFDEWTSQTDYHDYSLLKDYGVDLYSIDAKWEIEDVSEVGGEQATIEKVSFVADVEESNGNTSESVALFEVLNPNWKGESTNWFDAFDFAFNDNFGMYTEEEFTPVIQPGTSLTNVKMQLYANQNSTPIVYEMNDYKQPDLNGIDKLYDFSVEGYSKDGTYNTDYNVNIYPGLQKEADLVEAGWSTHVESDVEFTNFEIISIDERISEDDIDIIYSKYVDPSVTGNVTLKIENLTPSTTYNDLVVKMDWIDHLTGIEYTQTFDLINDYGLDFTTGGWEAPIKPTVVLNEVATTSTSTTFNWIITTEEPDHDYQSPAQINNVSIREKTTGETYDVTEDMSAATNVYSGVSTIEGLTPETTYKFDLVVNYSDISGGNIATVVTPIVTIYTGDYLDALQPTIKLEEGTPGYNSITVDYEITLPDPEANPENRPTELYSVKLYINDDTTPAAISKAGDLSDLDGNGIISGSLTATGLEPETSYDWHIEVESNAPENVIGATHTITTTMLSEPNAPFIVGDSMLLTPTDDYNTFRFDYKLNTIDEAEGQSPAYIDSVEFVYKGKTIGEQSFGTYSTTEGGQPIPEEGFTGSFNVTGLDWNTDVTNASLKVGYSGSSEGQEYSVDLSVDALSTPSLSAEGVQPNIKRAQVANNGGFKQVSSTEAVISYSVETPAVTLGTAAVEIDEIRIVDGTEVLARTTEHSGNILLTNLEAGTLYSELKLEVDYSYVRPSYDNNAGDDLGYGKGTVSKNVTPFTTLDEGEFSLSGNVQYVGYNEGNLEGVLTVFDSSNAFNTNEFRVSVKEGTGESAVRVEKAVKVTPIESTKNDKAESGIETTEYKIVINDIQEGVQYTSWKYTMSTLSHPDDSEWISFKIEDPITGNEFNTFYMPPTITNHNMIYIILDVILLVSALGLIVAVVMKATKKNDDDEEDETPVKKTKAVKGGNNE